MTTVYFNGQPVTLTGSFGVAERSAEMDDAYRLVDLADQALLAAKQAGRNRVTRATCLNWFDSHSPPPQFDSCAASAHQKLAPSQRQLAVQPAAG